MRTIGMLLAAAVVAGSGTGVIQARDYCGLRSASVIKVKSWKAEHRDGKMLYDLVLTSTHEKSIRQVGGTVEFVGKGGRKISALALTLPSTIPAQGEIPVTLTGSTDSDAMRLAAMTASDVHALACIDSVQFEDGSGLIIN